MNEAAREAEKRRPGACHHEAAHAVFSYHANQPIAYVTMGDFARRKNPESVARIQYTPGDPLSTGMVVAGVLIGKYAEELAAMGKRREHVPYEDFSEGIKEAMRTNTWPPGIEVDEVQAFSILARLGRQQAEKVYGAACASAPELVERWWTEIDALADRLLEVGRVDGAEARRIIVAARENKDERA